jgi:hypothetical protein
MVYCLGGAGALVGLELVASLGIWRARDGSRPRGAFVVIHCRDFHLITNFFYMMANFVLRSSRRMFTSRILTSPCNRLSITTRRGIASTEAAGGDASNLPLAGIKVLDMTRVLAGVSINCCSFMCCTYVC